MMTNRQRPNVETLAAVIAHSQIVFAPVMVHCRLPAGFDEIDVVILDWIADEARRLSRRFARI
jgi:hypothetical protein